MVAAPRVIPDAVRATQARASDPAASAFVSANAGSGKTHVLVQRVIRLLLTGVPPEKILCITFTKAAAANMAERVFSTLGHWITLDDQALTAAIRDAGVARVDASLRMRARELFASALETPGGLKVQTIHALCTRLLQQFPFEANVPARFTVLDERDQNEMMERANLGVLLEASRDPDSAAGRALYTAMASAADVTFKDVVREACLSRDHFMAWTDSAGSADAAAAQMSTALGVDPGDRIVPGDPRDLLVDVDVHAQVPDRLFEKRRRGGVERHLLAEYIPDVGPDGVVRGCYTLTVDITERRAAELEISRSEQRMADLTNAQIAEELYLAESTIKSHLSSAFAKFGVRSRKEAAALFLENDPAGAID